MKYKNKWEQFLAVLSSTTLSNVIGVAALLSALVALWITDGGQRILVNTTTVFLFAIAIIAASVFIVNYLRVFRRYITSVLNRIIDFTINTLFERLAKMGADTWHVFEAEHVWEIHDRLGESATYTKTVKGYCSTASASTYEDSYITNGDLPTQAECGITGGRVIDVRETETVDGERHFKIIALLDKPYKYGQGFNFTISRRVNNAFKTANEWVSTKILPSMHGSVEMKVRFPHDSLILGDKILLEQRSQGVSRDTTDPIKYGFFTGIDGVSNPEISAKLHNCKPGDNYTIRWEWILPTGANNTPPAA